MNEPRYKWNDEFKFSAEEMDMIEKINKFLTRPLSPRWIYYGLFDTPDAKQQRFLIQVLNKARKDRRELIKRDLVTDDTRKPIKWQCNDSLNDFIQGLNYTRNIWVDQPIYIEVWMEDEASLQAIRRSPKEILQEYMTNARYCKGFNSIGAMWQSYKEFKKLNKPILILYYGDLNPSGWAIPVVIVRQFQEMGLDIELKRRALNPNQLADLDIPEYTKFSADPRRKEFNQIFGYEHFEEAGETQFRDERTGKTKNGKEHLNIDLEKIPIEDFEEILIQDIADHIDMDANEISNDLERDEHMELRRIKNKYRDR